MVATLEQEVVVRCRLDNRELIVPADSVVDGEPREDLRGRQAGMAYCGPYGGFFCDKDHFNFSTED